MRAGLMVAGLGLALLTSCGGSPIPSPPATSTPAAVRTPSAVAATASPMPAREARVVISDWGTAPPGTYQVRLARLDATDVAVMPGRYVGVVADHVVAQDGLKLMALSYDGAVTQLGTVSAPPDAGPSTIVVSPDLSQWLYETTADTQSLTAQIRLGSATGDRVVATIPSPNDNGVFTPYAWNASGIYLVLRATGIGGAGPFLDYHFPLYRFDISTAAAAQVQPACTAYDVLSSGGLICGLNSSSTQLPGGLDIRSSDGHARAVPVATQFAAVTLSQDETRVALVGQGGTSADPQYQIETAPLTSPVLSNFGPPGYVPQAWLPDGRIIAHQSCLMGDVSTVNCDNANYGKAYVFSADGSSSTFFFNLAQSAQIVDVIA